MVLENHCNDVAKIDCYEILFGGVFTDLLDWLNVLKCVNDVIYFWNYITPIRLQVLNLVFSKIY
jgi:hypothetical protein